MRNTRYFRDLLIPGVFYFSDCGVMHFMRGKSISTRLHSSFACVYREFTPFLLFLLAILCRVMLYYEKISPTEKVG